MSDEYLKKIIKQAVRIRRLENAAAEHITKLLDAEFASLLSSFDAVDDERTRARIIRTFHDAIDERLPVLFEKLRQTAKRDAVAIAASESEKTAAAMLAASGKKAIANPVSVNRLKEIYETDSIEGHTVDEWFAHNQRKLAERIRLETRLGLERDKSLATTRAHIETDVLARSRRHAEALARTATANISNAAIWESGEANPTHTKGYRLIVTFDRRTSKICMAYGQRNLVYPYRAGSPRPPLHFLCRTIIQPVLIGRENEAPQDAGEWLTNQSAETQNEILGPRRADLFRKGRLDLSDLIRGDNSIASIPELRGVGAGFQL